MAITITATEARVRFGEALRKLESDVDIVIEKNGDPVGVLISMKRYEKLTNNEPELDWWERAARSREMVSRLRGGKPLPDVDDMINFGHDDE